MHLSLNYPKVYRVVTMTDHIHDLRLPDPYRQLEDPKAQLTKAFVEGQVQSVKSVPSTCDTQVIRESSTANFGCPNVSFSLGNKYTSLQAHSGPYMQDKLDEDGEVVLDPNTISLVRMKIEEAIANCLTCARSSSGSDWTKHAWRFSRSDYGQELMMSKDGTMVPMSVVAQQGLVPDLLCGFGGFNFSLAPAFSVSRLVSHEELSPEQRPEQGPHGYEVALGSTATEELIDKTPIRRRAQCHNSSAQPGTFVLLTLIALGNLPTVMANTTLGWPFIGTMVGIGALLLALLMGILACWWRHLDQVPVAALALAAQPASPNGPVVPAAAPNGPVVPAAAPNGPVAATNGQVVIGTVMGNVVIGIP